MEPTKKTTGTTGGGEVFKLDAEQMARIRETALELVAFAKQLRDKGKERVASLGSGEFEIPPIKLPVPTITFTETKIDRELLDEVAKLAKRFPFTKLMTHRSEL